MRSIGRVGMSDAATIIVDAEHAPDSPTLIASRSVPPHEGEGGQRAPLGLRIRGTNPVKQAFDIDCASPYGAR